VIFLASALILAAALLVAGLAVLRGGGAQTKAGAVGADELSVTWTSDGGVLSVRGGGFRPHSVATVRVGSQAAVQAQIDATGAVRLDVTLNAAIAGLAGTSVIVTGKAPYGATRTLVAASPPKLAGHGPVDAAPWLIGAALVISVLAAILGRGGRRIAGVRRHRRGNPIWSSVWPRVSILGRR
jgi:hypothetical protein